MCRLFGFERRNRCCDWNDLLDTWSSQLICYREVTKLSTNTMPATGKYVLSLQPGSQTNGRSTNGYAALVINARGVIAALSGALPDNTTFAQSARVSKEGIWPLYAVPAGDKNNGMLIGWETTVQPGVAAASCIGIKRRISALIIRAALAL